MNPIEPIAPLDASPVMRLGNPAASLPHGGPSFADVLGAGVAKVDAKLSSADALVRQFALDDTAVPLHRVTYALEEARLAVELAMQVRTRLVESYRELMGMQL